MTEGLRERETDREKEQEAGAKEEHKGEPESPAAERKSRTPLVFLLPFALSLSLFCSHSPDTDEIDLTVRYSSFRELRRGTTG